MSPLTENALEYLLVFRHLGLITSCPRWVLDLLVVPGKMGYYNNEEIPQIKGKHYFSDFYFCNHIICYYSGFYKLDDKVKLFS